MGSFEREEQFLEDQLASGEISNKQFNAYFREIQIRYQAEAEEAAQRAYDNVYERW